MSVLSDRDIARLCDPKYLKRVGERVANPTQEQFFDPPDYTEHQQELTPDSKPMIEPFIPHQVKTRDSYVNSKGNVTVLAKEQKILSYGLSSAGYDVRLDNQFKIFSNAKATVIDPLDMRDDYYVDHIGDYCIIPPNGYILGVTLETFNIPRDIIVSVWGKSTLARCGALVNTTLIEPGFQGRIVVEAANCSSVPIKIHAGMGIAQFKFERLSSPCITSYGDRDGKYNHQSDLVTARV